MGRLQNVRRTVAVGSVLLAAVAAAGIGGAEDSAQASPSDPPPVAVTGTVVGVAELGRHAVMAQIMPDQDLIDSFHGSVNVHAPQVPQDWITVDGASYTIRLDPVALPAGTISESGLVTLEIYAQDPAGPRFGYTTASLRAAVGPDGAYAWTDPLAATADLDDSGKVTRAAISTFTADEDVTDSFVQSPVPVTASVERLTVDGVLCDGTGCAETTAQRPAKTVTLAGPYAVDDETDGGGTSTDISDPEVRGDCSWPEGAGTVYTNKKRSVSTTVGTAYPVQNDTAWMSHQTATSSSDEFTAKFGIASDGGVGIYQEQKEKQTVERSVGFTWDKKDYARSFRLGVKYTKVGHYFDTCPPGEPYYWSWNPTGYSGSFGENTSGVSRPDWPTGNCVAITSTGTWTRDAKNGSSYSLSTGVQSGDFLGIDMTSIRAYNNEAKLNYKIGLEGRRMCGNNDYPGTAAKVMERAKP